MFKKYHLNKQIQLSFLFILICTLVSTILTMVIFFVLATMIAYPANHYDRQIPDIMAYVESHADDLLQEKNRESFESQLDLNQIKYAIVNFKEDNWHGNKVELTDSEEQLITKLNTRESDGQNNFTSYSPILNANGQLEGCLILSYPIRMIPIQNRQLLFGILFVLVFSLPFIYLIFYMWLFGRQLKLNIMDPLLKLQRAANQIRSNDLDFELDYDYPNELGEVIVSFEQMRQELKRTLYRQWQLEQQQKEMIGALAHDLRSPLTIIKGHVELLQDGAYLNEDRCLKYLDSIEGAVNRATLLVEDLNLLSDLDKVQLTLKLEPINLSSFLETKVNEYQALANQKNIKLNLEIAPGIGEEAFQLNSLRMSQVVDNIIMNAFRYTETLISVSMDLSEIDEVVINFYNDGPEFTKEEIEKAMHRFYRGDDSRSSQEAHSGLGLYICKRLIEQQGGRMELENHTSGGACVKLIFPSDAGKGLFEKG